MNLGKRYAKYKSATKDHRIVWLQYMEEMSKIISSETSKWLPRVWGRIWMTASEYRISLGNEKYSKIRLQWQLPNSEYTKKHWIIYFNGWIVYLNYTSIKGFPSGASGKDPPANAGDVRDMSSIFGSEISQGEGIATLSILAWRMERGT